MGGGGSYRIKKEGVEGGERGLPYMKHSKDWG